MSGTVSILDLVKMSEWCYGNASEKLSSDWKALPAIELVENIKNYRLVPFINDKEKIMVCAYRGTANLENVLNDDIKIPMGLIFNYYEFSLSEIKKLHEKYKEYQFIHTGHSLGGANAILVAGHYGERAVAFDAPGIASIVNKQIEIKKETDITVYQSTPNIVNQCDTHLPQTKIIKVKHTNEIKEKLTELLKQKDITYEHFILNPAVESNMDRIKNFLAYQHESHKISNIVKAIRQFSIEEYTINSGDTLSSISKNRYGFIQGWKKIYEDNRNILGNNPDVIHPGKKIQIHFDTPKFS